MAEQAHPEWDASYTAGLGPRRIRQDELRAAFSDGWTVESVTPATFEIRPVNGTTEVHAWLATIRRTSRR